MRRTSSFLVAGLSAGLAAAALAALSLPAAALPLGAMAESASALPSPVEQVQWRGPGWRGSPGWRGGWGPGPGPGWRGGWGPGPGWGPAPGWGWNRPVVVGPVWGSGPGWGWGPGGCGWGGCGWGWGPGVGFATGVMVGSALAAPPVMMYGGAPASNAVAYCMRRFRSYNPATGTYLGYDGRRHRCP